MQINPQTIKKQFEKSLDKYNENAFVQRAMAEKLVELLPDKNYSKILELGCGTGILTKELYNKIKFDKFYANDLIQQTKKFLDEILANYELLIGNAQKIKPSSKMDLIISNAMFQWFKNPKTIFEHCKTLLNPNGILAFSTFGPNNFKEIKKLTGLSLEYKTSKELAKNLSEHFEIITILEFEQVLKFNNVLELLAHMKNTGVNSLNSKTWTFAQVKEFCTQYTNLYPEITLTYAPIIIIAKRK